MVMRVLPLSVCASHGLRLAHQLCGVAPFVVVPAHHFHQITVDDLGQGAIDDRRWGVVDDVGRDDRLVGHADDVTVTRAPASSRKMQLTSLTLVGRATRHTMSAIDTTGTGARIATPSNLPSYSGSALVVAFAAPVLAGIRLAAAARPRRRSLLGRSTSAWLAVYAWVVVMVAFRMPSRRPRISITGVMQFVVQLAHETMFVLRSALLTP